MDDMPDKRVHGTIAYAIIGGGVAGTYCAWRLKEKFPDKEIVLFEYSNRIGGRLLTTSLPQTNMKIELGGMRFISEQQPYFNYLVKRFKLETRPFPMGPKDDKEGKKNYAYFRGRHLRIGDFANSEKLPYSVDPSERNKTPDDLQRHVAIRVTHNKEPDKIKLKKWLNIKFRGRYLWEWGFWNLLYKFLTPEAYQFLKYGSGYDTNVSNGNAVILLPTGGEYSSENNYLTLTDGMDALPKRLHQEFQKLGGKCELNHRLDSIKREGKDYNLHFTLTKTDNEHQEKTTSTDKPRNYKAKRVILAMPKAALERIDWAQFKKAKVRELLDSVLIQEAVKIFLAYDHAWWKSLGLVYGRSITDLPLRQTYYFTDPSDDDPKERISKTSGVLMASYSDLESVPFWHGLKNDRDYNGPEEGYRATHMMVQEAHRQVMKIHNRPKKVGMPYAAAYHDWGDMPSGGGWHCWKAGYKYKNIMKRIRHPVKGEEVYICGEAYSANQGWAEGALETAEMLLVELGLQRLLPDLHPRFLAPPRYAPLAPSPKRGFDGKNLYDAKGRLVE
jgi:lysine 2-monooxygenase